MVDNNQEVERPLLNPMITYFRSKDGYGGACSHEALMIQAILITQLFETCTKEEYEEACNKYAAQRAYEKAKETPKLHTD